MAQVTMTGKEYQELLEYKSKWEEMVCLLCECKFPDMSLEPEDERWRVQTKAGAFDWYPNWLRDMIKSSTFSHVLNLPEHAFRNLVHHNMHYYDMVECSFSDWDCNTSTFDILTNPEVQKRWDEYKKWEEELESGSDEE